MYAVKSFSEWRRTSRPRRRNEMAKVYAFTAAFYLFLGVVYSVKH